MIGAMSSIRTRKIAARCWALADWFHDNPKRGWRAFQAIVQSRIRVPLAGGHRAAEYQVSATREGFAADILIVSHALTPNERKGLARREIPPFLADRISRIPGLRRLVTCQLTDRWLVGVHTDRRDAGSILLEFPNAMQEGGAGVLAALHFV
jgi:hypothetical protein